MQAVQIDKTYNPSANWRALAGILFMLCIVLSSCAVKSSIKSFLGIDFTQEQKHPGNLATGNAAVYNPLLDCQYNSSSQELTFQKSDSNSLTKAAAVLLFTFVLYLFYGPQIVRNKKAHPRYNSAEITGSLPLFLQQRKLII